MMPVLCPSCIVQVHQFRFIEIANIIAQTDEPVLSACTTTVFAYLFYLAFYPLETVPSHVASQQLIVKIPQQPNCILPQTS